MIIRTYQSQHGAGRIAGRTGGPGLNWEGLAAFTGSVDRARDSAIGSGGLGMITATHPASVSIRQVFSRVLPHLDRKSVV